MNMQKFPWVILISKAKLCHNKVIKKIIFIIYFFNFLLRFMFKMHNIIIHNFPIPGIYVLHSSIHLLPWIKAYCLHEEFAPAEEVLSMGEGCLSMESKPIFRRVSEKTTVNSQQLSWQERLGIKPSTLRLPVLRVELLGHL